MQEIGKVPNLFSFVIAVSSAILTTWTLLGRISARFNKALDIKLAPLVKELKDQGDKFAAEANRLEKHFDAAIKEVESRGKREITDAMTSLRQEMKLVADRHHNLEMTVNTNVTRVEGNTRVLQETLMDQKQLRRDSDAQQRQLDAIEAAQEKTQEKIVEAINSAKDKLSNAQGDLSTRLTRVEEALKFWASVRVDEERSGT